MTTLYHYTCSHGRALIGREGWLLPMSAHAPRAAATVAASYQWLTSTIWLTDMDEPDAEALGLTRRSIACDRTEFRYLVTQPADARPFTEWSRTLDREIRRTVLDGLVYAEPDARPRHWWVATEPVAVVLT